MAELLIPFKPGTAQPLQAVYSWMKLGEHHVLRPNYTFYADLEFTGFGNWGQHPHAKFRGTLYPSKHHNDDEHPEYTMFMSDFEKLLLGANPYRAMREWPQVYSHWTFRKAGQNYGLCLAK